MSTEFYKCIEEWAERCHKQSQQIDMLRSALKRAGEVVCSNCCDTTKKKDEEWGHCASCQAIQKALLNITSPTSP